MLPSGGELWHSAFRTSSPVRSSSHGTRCQPPPPTFSFSCRESTPPARTVGDDHDSSSKWSRGELQADAGSGGGRGGDYMTGRIVRTRVEGLGRRTKQRLWVVGSEWWEGKGLRGHTDPSFSHGYFCGCTQPDWRWKMHSMGRALLNGHESTGQSFIWYRNTPLKCTT